MPTLKSLKSRKGLPALILLAATMLASPAAVANAAGDEILEPAQSLEGNFLSAYVAGSARDTEAG